MPSDSPKVLSPCSWKHGWRWQIRSLFSLILFFSHPEMRFALGKEKHWFPQFQRMSSKPCWDPTFMGTQKTEMEFAIVQTYFPPSLCEDGLQNIHESLRLPTEIKWWGVVGWQEIIAGFPPQEMRFSSSPMLWTRRKALSGSQKLWKYILFPPWAYNNLKECPIKDFTASLSKRSDWRVRNSSLSNSCCRKDCRVSRWEF